MLMGVSRTSKTPNRHLSRQSRAEDGRNIPARAPNMPLPPQIEKMPSGRSSWGWWRGPERIVQIRQNRLLSLNAEPETDYTDRERVAEEIAYSRKLYARKRWPVIDVTRRSIEETAAAILEQLSRAPDEVHRDMSVPGHLRPLARPPRPSSSPRPRRPAWRSSPPPASPSRPLRPDVDERAVEARALAGGASPEALAVTLARVEGALDLAPAAGEPSSSAPTRPSPSSAACSTSRPGGRPPTSRSRRSPGAPTRLAFRRRHRPRGRESWPSNLASAQLTMRALRRARDRSVSGSGGRCGDDERRRVPARRRRRAPVRAGGEGVTNSTILGLPNLSASRRAARSRRAGALSRSPPDTYSTEHEVMLKAFVARSSDKPFPCSPLIHGYWLRRHGIDGAYETADVPPADFPRFLRGLGLSGYMGGQRSRCRHKGETGVPRVARWRSSPGAAQRLRGRSTPSWLEDGGAARRTTPT